MAARSGNARRLEPGIRIKEELLLQFVEDGHSEARNELVHYFEPLRQAFEEVVKQPGYTAEVWELGWDPRYSSTIYPQQNFYARRMAFRAQQARVIQQLSDGHEEAAIADLALLFRAAACHPHSRIITQWVCVDWLIVALHTNEEVMRKLSNEAFMEQVKQVLVENRASLESIRFHEGIEPVTQYHIGMARYFRRVACLDRIEPESMTGLDCFLLVSKGQLECFEKYSLPRAETREDRKQVEKYIRQEKKRMDSVKILQAREDSNNPLLAIRRGLALTDAAIQFKIINPNWDNIMQFVDATFDDYDRTLTALQAKGID